MIKNIISLSTGSNIPFNKIIRLIDYRIGSGIVVNFAPSPGISGFYAGVGVTSISTKRTKRHDWYAAISASPDSIGNKTQYGMFFALEYI